MATYEELMKQASELMRQAEQARRDEIAGAISDIKALMAKHGISATELGFVPNGRVKSGAKAQKAKGVAKYRGPNGELWAGGPGRRPAWVQEVIASGKNIEDFKI